MHRRLNSWLLNEARKTEAAEGLQHGFPICLGCGWSSDDRELDLCCDCADKEFMAQLLRGDYGPAEKREARASMRKTA